MKVAASARVTPRSGASEAADVMDIASQLLLFLALLATASADVSNKPCTCISNVLDCSARGKTNILPQEICSNASKVNLDNNQLSVFPEGLQNFEEVSANYNNISRLPDASLVNPRLKVLRLKFNRIKETSEELISLSSLEELRLDYNELTSLEFLPQTCNLRILSLLNTKISNLQGPLQSCKKLTYLYISSGNISVLNDDIFSPMSHLEELWLSDMNIVSIPDGTLQNMSQIKTLILSFNNKINLSESSFRGLRNLEKVDLSGCSLKTIPSSLFSSTPRIENIDLTSNKLKSLPGDLFTGLHWLTEVKLARNFLSDIPLIRNCCAHLETFDLYANTIRSLSEETLRTTPTGSATIDLQGNPIQPQSMRWVLRSSDVSTFVSDSCNCGGIKLKGTTVKFCVEIQCGREDTPVDWKDAVENFE